MENVVREFIGKTISCIKLDGELTIRFSDGMALCLADDMRLCCECRYMHTDDDLSEAVGGVLHGIEVRDAPSGADDDSDHVHEVQFLVVMTSNGTFTVCTHNEHNGYYGGISVVARRVNLLIN